jgi:hypothetical protein
MHAKISGGRRQAPANSLNLPSLCADSFAGPGFFDQILERLMMPKATRISASLAASSYHRQRPEGHPLVSIALFSALGLLISLVATMMGVQGVWY